MTDQDATPLPSDEALRDVARRAVTSGVYSGNVLALRAVYDRGRRDGNAGPAVDALVAAVEVEHWSVPFAKTHPIPICWRCSDSWPCPTVQAVAAYKEATKEEA